MEINNFEKLSPDQYKINTKNHWSESPCGSNYSGSEPYTEKYFNEIESHRYETHPWILKSIESFDIKNKKVLEIGLGVGTDHLNLARQGAEMYGIDLTKKCVEVTGNRLKIFGLQSYLVNGDAENLPFEEEVFDFVYSFGVIHHSPDTQKIIDEVHRVLKPGGKCFITVYNKNSIFFWWTTYLYNFLWKKSYKKRTLTQQISLIEYPNNSEDMIIRLYNPNEFRVMFSSFSTIKCYVKQLLFSDIAIIDRIFKDDHPNKFLSFLGNIFGWYIVIEATK
ncbi:MAG: class I SAM-dependent methyltransferase [Cyanobacteriota bacterium]|jgi:ubiquinone/menaquinone biosynthesis C-methylase UbiE